MNFFKAKGYWNWVDESNVSLGYQIRKECCVLHGWYLTDSVPGERPDPGYDQPEFDWTPWRFDPSFEDRIDVRREWFDQGNGAVFRILNGDQAKYLTIYNHHNGYYLSRFHFKVDGKPLREGEYL